MEKTVVFSAVLLSLLNYVLLDQSHLASQETIQCLHSQAPNILVKGANLICTPRNGATRLILVREVNGGNKSAFGEISKQCNGKRTCDLKPYLWDQLTGRPNDRVRIDYSCLTVIKPYVADRKDQHSGPQMSKSAINVSQGFLQTPLELSLGANWTLIFHYPKVQFVELVCVSNLKVFDTCTQEFTEEFNLNLMLTKDKDNVTSQKSCVPVENGKINMEVRTNLTRQPLYRDIPFLIYFQSVRNCSDSNASSSDHTMGCKLKKISEPTEKDADDDQVNNTAVWNGDSSGGQGKGDDINEDKDTSKENIVIVVVAVVAALVIIVCVAVLVARIIRKKRKRERPLLMKSAQKEERGHEGPQSQEVTLREFTVFPGQHGQKEANFSYMPAPAGHLMNTSLTDAIDLDADLTDEPAQPSDQQTTKQMTYKAALERQITPVSYESAFEGTLEEVVQELARHSQDSDSDECLSPDDMKNNAKFQYPRSSAKEIQSTGIQDNNLKQLEELADPRESEEETSAIPVKTPDDAYKSDDGDKSNGHQPVLVEPIARGESKEGHSQDSSEESNDEEKTSSDSTADVTSSEINSLPEELNKEEPDYDLAESWSTDVIVDGFSANNPSATDRTGGVREDGEGVDPVANTSPGKDNESDYEDIENVPPSQLRIDPEGEDSDLHGRAEHDGSNRPVSLEMTENDLYQAADV